MAYGNRPHMWPCYFSSFITGTLVSHPLFTLFFSSLNIYNFTYSFKLCFRFERNETQKVFLFCFYHFLKDFILARLEPHQPFFLLLFWRWVLAFFPGQPGSCSSYFMFPAVTGMTGTCYHTQLFPIEMKSHKFFFSLPRLAWNHRAQPPAITVMIGMSHCAQLLCEIGVS
jgi:hypothetical protein